MYKKGSIYINTNIDINIINTCTDNDMEAVSSASPSARRPLPPILGSLRKAVAYTSKYAYSGPGSK